MIELIPWVHYDASDAHRKAIRYIQGLPRGSVLGVEQSRGELHFFQQEIKRAKQMREKLERGVVEVNATNPGYRANMDIVLACTQAGVTIIPLEENNLKETAMNASDFHKYAAQREEAMAKAIQRHAPANGRMYVLVGAAHVSNIYDILKQNRAPVVVRTRILEGMRKNLGDLVKLERRNRKATDKEPIAKRMEHAYGQAIAHAAPSPRDPVRAAEFVMRLVHFQAQLPQHTQPTPYRTGPKPPAHPKPKKRRRN